MTTTDPVPRVPAVGSDPRKQSVVTEPQGKTFFRELDESVIEADRCIQCGTCVAACPSDSIGIDPVEERPTLVRMCTGCSRCWDFCPRSGLRYERLVAMEAADQPDPPEMVAARAIDDDLHHHGQDSGTVTAILASLLETGAIDGALVAMGSDPPIRGEAYLATSRAELIAASGSKYNQPMQLGRFHECVDELDLESPQIAVVGTPCVIQGAAALERYDWDDEAKPIALTVALMCTRTFAWDRLETQLGQEGVDPTSVHRLDVDKGRLSAIDANDEILLETSVDRFDSAALRGCAECADFVGGAADISVGNVGSPSGYSTVVLRSARGRDAWEGADSAIETTSLDGPKAVTRLQEWNHTRAEAALPRPFDPDGSLTITYEAHRSWYDETDRAPQALNPARVYQYEEWC